jgi:hypothetical protein
MAISCRSGELVDIMDVADTCVFPATRYTQRITGNAIFSGGGVCVVADKTSARQAPPL